MTFGYSSLSRADLLSCLECLPKLTKLRVTDNGISAPTGRVRRSGLARQGPDARFHNAILTKLTPKFDQSGHCTEDILCPRLEVFSSDLLERGEAAFTREALANFIANRRRAFNSDPSIAAIKEVQVWCRAGEDAGLNEQEWDGSSDDLDLNGCRVIVHRYTHELDAGSLWESAGRLAVPAFYSEGYYDI